MQSESLNQRTARVFAIAVALLAAFCLGWAAFGAGLAYAEPAEGEPAEGATQENAQPEAAPAESTTSQQEETSSSSSASSTTSTAGTDMKAGAMEGQGIVIGNDVFFTGQNLETSNVTVPANLFATGQALTLRNSIVGADVFVAGESMNLDTITAGNNLFVAGNSLTVSNTTAKNVFAAGNNLDLDFDAENLNAAGKTVFLKGTFTGDVNVQAANVIVDPYIQVAGSLNVTAEQEPTIASTAKIGSFNYNQAEPNNSSATNVLNMPEIGSAAWLWSLLFMFLGMLLLGVIMLLVTRTEVIDGAGAVVKERPLAIFVSGLLGMILIPVLVGAFFLTVIGWTVAVALLFLMILITIFAGTFTAIALGRAIFSGINKWISSIIMIAVFALLMCLPIANFVVDAISTLFFTGCVIQGWWVWRRKPASPTDFGGPAYEDFSVPRGTHVSPPVTEQAIPPVRTVDSVPSSNSADYQVPVWKD